MSNITGKFGVFVYNKNDDKNVSYDFCEEKEIAIKYAKKLALITIIKINCYVEVWKRDEEYLFGNTGKPIWKSDSK